MDSLQDTPARVEALSGLSRFRTGLHACFTRRGDALFELADAMLCAQGPVRSPVELSLEPEFRRRHGSVYEALAQGRISSSGLRHLLAGLSAPARAGEPLMFAIDTTPHARPDAQYADERTMVQVRGKGGDRWLPGWPYSLLVGIQWGSSSWVDPIEARRLKPGEEHTDVTIDQITGLLKDLTATGKWQPGDPPPLVLLDAGNYATDLTHALAGHDVQLLVRLRSTRVFYLDPAPRRPGQMGAPARHGAEFSCSDPARRHTPDFEHTAESGLYGTVTVRAWTGLHQKLGSTGRWASWPRDTQLPIVRGTVLQVVVGHLPDGRTPPKDLWLWHAGPVPADPDLLWKAYLRRSGHRPVGGSGHGCLRPATPRPPPRRRPAPPLAPTARPGQAPQPLQGPARLPPTPRTNRHTRPLAQTRPPWSRPPERLEESPQIQATALPQERTDHQQTRRVTTEA